LGILQEGKKFEVCGVEIPEKLEQNFTRVLRSKNEKNEHLLWQG